MAHLTFMELRSWLRPGNDFISQCQAASKIPEYLMYHPRSDEIKATFRLLAERFQSEDNNYLRSIIMRIIQEISPKYIHQITQIEDQEIIIYNLNFVVSHSGDSAARTIALKTLGAIADIAVDKNDVRHSIRQRLLSKDPDERMAAVRTATIFIKKSVSFANEMMAELDHIIFEQKFTSTVRKNQQPTDKLSPIDENAIENQILQQQLITAIFTEILPEMTSNLKISEKVINLCLRAINYEKFGDLALKTSIILVKKVKPLANMLISVLFLKVDRIFVKIEEDFVKKEENGNENDGPKLNLSKKEKTFNKKMLSGIIDSLLTLSLDLPRTWSLKNGIKCINLLTNKAKILYNENKDDFENLAIICANVLATHSTLLPSLNDICQLYETVANGQNDLTLSRSIFKIFKWNSNQNSDELQLQENDQNFPVQDLIYIILDPTHEKVIKIGENIEKSKDSDQIIDIGPVLARIKNEESQLSDEDLSGKSTTKIGIKRKMEFSSLKITESLKKSDQKIGQFSNDLTLLLLPKSQTDIVHLVSSLLSILAKKLDTNNRINNHYPIFLNLLHFLINKFKIDVWEKKQQQQLIFEFVCKALARTTGTSEIEQQTIYDIITWSLTEDTISELNYESAHVNNILLMKFLYRNQRDKELLSLINKQINEGSLDFSEYEPNVKINFEFYLKLAEAEVLKNKAFSKDSDEVSGYDDDDDNDNDFKKAFYVSKSVELYQKAILWHNNYQTKVGRFEGDDKTVCDWLNQKIQLILSEK